MVCLCGPCCGPWLPIRLVLEVVHSDGTAYVGVVVGDDVAVRVDLGVHAHHVWHGAVRAVEVQFQCHAYVRPHVGVHRVCVRGSVCCVRPGGCHRGGSGVVCRG